MLTWVRLAFRLLVRMKGLRGTLLDPFGHTQERRLERRLAGDYEGLVERELLPRLRVDSLPLAVRIAETAQLIRGYGHVKAAGIAAARAQWRELLAQWHQGPDGSAGAAPAGRRVIGIKPLAEAVRGPLGKARQSVGKS